MATGLSFDDLIPKGGSNAQPTGLSFDDLIPKERDTAQKAYDNLYNTFVAKPTEAYKSAVQDFNQSAGEDLKAEGEALDAPNPLEYVAAKAQNLPHKLGTALKAVAVPFAPIMAGARELAQQTVSPGANPDQYYADLAAGKVQEEPVYGPNRRAAAAGFVAENAVGLAPIPGAAEARIAKVAQVERAAMADRAAARFAAEDAARPPAPPPEVVAEPVMAAGTVDDAIAAAKEAVSAPAPRIIDFSDLIPAREAPRVEPAALPEPVRTAEPLPSTLPREAAIEPPQALSFEGLVGQEPVTVRPAEPQPGQPVPQPVLEPILQGRVRGGQVERATDDAVSLLASKGGIRNDEAHDLIKGRGLQQFVPGRGPLIRPTGMSIDQAGLHLWEDGYFGPPESTPRPTENEVLQLLERTAGGKKVRPPEMQAEADAAEYARYLDDEEYARAGVGVSDPPEVVNQKLTAFRQSQNHDTFVGEHEAAISDHDLEGLLPDELRSLESYGYRRPEYEPGSDLGAELEESAGNGAGVGERTYQPAIEAENAGGNRPPEGARELPQQDNAQALAVEPGAEGLPQTVIPGTGRASLAEIEATLARRKIEESRQLPRANSGKVQKPNDQGLFAPPPEKTLFRVGESNAAPAPSRGILGVFSPEFEARRAEVSDTLRTRLDDIGLHDVAVGVADALKIGETRVHGAYLDKIIAISLEAPDVAGTLDHEAIHAFRGMGLFNKSEWSILREKAERDWRKRYNIDGRYGAFDEATWNEEAVAEAFREWKSGAWKPTGTVARLFDKMRNAVSAIGNGLRGLGFRSADDIFGKIETGEIGARERGGEVSLGRGLYAQLPEYKPGDIRNGYDVKASIEAAKKAIASGADIGAVIRRLSEQGIVVKRDLMGIANEETKPANANRPLQPNALTPVAGTGEVKPRGLSEHIEAKAAEKALTEGFEDIPEYRQVSMSEQKAAAQKIVDANYEDAKAIAMGRKAPPRNVLPEAVMNAVERKALEDGDVETIRQLATQSRLTTEATTMGQRIRTLGERDQASPVAAIQAVQAARAEAMKARKVEPVKATAETVRVIRKEVRKTASRQSWNDFIVSITCGN